MKKKQSRSVAKTAAKPTLKLRKVTVRDLSARKTSELKGASEFVSIRQRCR